MSNDKTLATVKHGGEVQLADSERARFDAFLRGNPFMAFMAGTAWQVWQAALSAQPSPGGQGDARTQFEAYRGGDFERDAQGYYTNARTAQDWSMWQAALATRQPVGEPVAWMTHHDEPMLFSTAAEAAAYCEDDEQPVLLFRSSAQAVYLDELRRAVCVVGVVGQIDGHDVVRRNSVLDVIDGKAVGNG